MSRLQYWRENPWTLSVTYRHEGDDDPLQKAWAERITNPKRPRTASEMTTGEIVRGSKEIIYFRNERGLATFHYIGWILDLGTAELFVGPTWEEADPDRDGLLRTIGLAMAYHVPIVPDTPDLAPELQALEREVLAQGFTVGEGAEKTRLVHSTYARLDINAVEALELLNRAEPVMPTEARVLFATARRELDARAEAGQILRSLRLAVAELSEALDSSDRNEGSLQLSLTRHPILFGAEYSRLEPKFRRGGDYQLDFALVRWSGLVDLVEIEASTHAVFNKRGDPTSHLVHAEQQVLDWLAWLDRYGELARRDLPDIQRPVGYVVIGRDVEWDEATHHRLQQRNLVLGGALHVMTWDGLLRRADVLLRHLEGLSAASQ